MKQIICDKCGKKLITAMVNNKGMDEIFGNLQEMLGEMGMKGNSNPKFIEEIEGSKVIINLPKHKTKRDFDLCEKCTKEHLKYLKGWFPEWNKEK